LYWKSPAGVLEVQRIENPTAYFDIIVMQVVVDHAEAVEICI